MTVTHQATGETEELRAQLRESRSECEHLKRLLSRCREHVQASREVSEDLLTELDRDSGQLPHVRIPRPKQLSAREHEIACLMYEGLKVKEVAQHLNISDHTVRNHLKSVYKKLQVTSMYEMVRALNEGAAA